MQSVVIEFNVEEGLCGGDAYNAYAGLDADGLPDSIDYDSPLNVEPVAVAPGVDAHPGWDQVGYMLWPEFGDPDVGVGGEFRAPVLRADVPVISFVTEALFYFGLFVVAVRPVSAGGDEQTSSTPTKTLTVNSAPRSPTDVVLSSYDDGADQVVIGFAASPQLG